MMTTLTRRAAMVCGLLAATAIDSVALAGPIPPPRQDSHSPTGVSYKTGAFSHQQRDLLIGGAPFPIGLSLDRSYLSSLDSAFNQGIKSQGWTHNLMARVTNHVIENAVTREFPPAPGTEKYLYSVSMGSGSVGFLGGSTNPTGGYVGTYRPANWGGESLVFTGDEQTGTFTFTDSDGGILRFNSRSAGMRVTSWTAPDGTSLSFNYDSDGLRSVISNRGYGLLFEFGTTPNGRSWTKACAVNLAVTYATALSSCPAGSQSVSYSYTAGTSWPTLLTGVTNAAGQTTSYSYVGADHLGCVKLPGQSSCQVSNVYNICTRDPKLQTDPYNLRWMDQVISQTTATGETYSYSFPTAPICPDPKDPQATQTIMTSRSGAVTTVDMNSAGLPTTIRDALGRTRSMTYLPPISVSSWHEATELTSLTEPERNAAEYKYDSRADIIEHRLKAKPNTLLADIVATASYPSSCTNPKTCNKPDFEVDANGNRTDYTYSPDHGGVLTETGPAVDGVRPQKRYSYAQRYAWIKNSSGGYSRAGTPVWVKTQEAFCKSGAATTTGCAIAGDEVKTAYDYGPDGGPNTLLLRGTVVDPGGLSLRTCYRYDVNGNKISETAPKAGLTSCA